MNERKENQKQQTIQQKRVCDFCGESVALLYCRADAAKLCLSCDCKVHSTNQLFTKHTRSLLCDACHSSPASIYCSTDVSVHCQNCDWERHKLFLSTLHDRRPLEGFTGCPSVTELLAIIGFEDVDEKALFDADDELLGSGNFGSLCAIDGFSDLLVWDTPSFVRLDDLIPSSNSVYSFQGMGVPPLPKNRNAAFGQQKEEILSQLRRMAALETNFDNGEEGIEDLIGFQDLVPERNIQLKDTCTGFQNESDPVSVPLYDPLILKFLYQEEWRKNEEECNNRNLHLQANALQWCNDSVKVADQSFPSTLLRFETIHLGPDKDSDIGDSSSHANPDHAGKSCHPVNNKTLKILPKVVSCELTSQERDSAISRYKEKKKNRRYDKHIRYESRKVRAERRIRIRGRFAKMDHKTLVCGDVI